MIFQQARKIVKYAVGQLIRNDKHRYTGYNFANTCQIIIANNIVKAASSFLLAIFTLVRDLTIC